MQEEFNFSAESLPVPAGYSAWRAERAAVLAELGRANGLPLNHPCHVELRDGTCLDGILRLAEENLLVETDRDLRLELCIGRCTFLATEIASVVRLD